MKNCIIAALVAVIAVGGVLVAVASSEETIANVEVRVWQRISDGSLYLSTRPQDGRWDTHETALDMSEISRSGNFRQSSFVTVAVPVTVEVAEPTPSMVTAPPTAYWFEETYYDPIDDTPTYHVISDSSAVILKEWRYSSLDEPSIVLKCHKGTFDAYVNWDTLVFGRFSDDTVGVEWRIDSRPARSERWLESTGSYATFSPRPETFARALLGGSELTIRATDRQGGEFTARFHLDGLSDFTDTLTCFRP